MIFIKNRLIIGTLKKIIGAIFKFAYKIINALNLQLALFVGILGVILYFTGALSNGTVLLCFYFAIIISVVIALVGTVRGLLGLGKGKNKKNPNLHIVETPDFNSNASAAEDEARQPAPSNVPVYYAVKQNSAYVMAEYADRYELLLKTANGFKKIRTDYK